MRILFLLFRMEIMSILLKLIDRDAASVEKGRALTN
jgi:hypothetical protein